MALHRIRVYDEAEYFIEAPDQSTAEEYALEWFAERQPQMEVSPPLCPCQFGNCECPEEFPNCRDCVAHYVRGE